MPMKVGDYKKKRRTPAAAKKKSAAPKVYKETKTAKVTPKKRKFEASTTSPSSSDSESEEDTTEKADDKEESKDEKKVEADAETETEGDDKETEEVDGEGDEEEETEEADGEGDDEEEEEDDKDSPYLSHSYSRISLWASNWILPDTLSRYDELVDDFSTELVNKVRVELKMKPHHLLACAKITDDQLFDAIQKVQWKIIPLPRFLKVGDISEEFWEHMGHCRYPEAKFPEYRKETLRAFKADLAE